MKNDRAGDWLWEEWDGEGFEAVSDDHTAIYSTSAFVELTNDLVKRALASCLQRDGVAHSLSDGFKMIEAGTVTHGYAGFIDGENFPTVCDNLGVSEYGDFVDKLTSMTWVEL